MKGQGALEYLIIIAAVLAIAAVVVMFLTGAFGGQRTAAEFNACKYAASECNVTRILVPNDPCNNCNTACMNTVTGKDLISGEDQDDACSTPYKSTSACGLCKQGNTTGIYSR